MFFYIGKTNSYLQWQKQHEIFHFNPLEDLKLDLKIGKEKKTYYQIDVSLNNLSDILTVLDKHPYADDTEYNIDLKSLHNVRDELEQFNNMVGNEQFKKSIGENVDYRRIEFVGPKVGSELKMIAIKAILFSLIAMFIYIWFRFSGWQFGLGALIALFHDVISTLGFFSISQIEFNLASIAAILTIAGYSINDTVVVFDRIRENLVKSELELSNLLNKSINQTLSRTFMTSVTTLLALLALYIFGGEVIKGFVSAMIWGVVIGTYSSIFIASPLIVLFGFKYNKK